MKICTHFYGSMTVYCYPVKCCVMVFVIQGSMTTVEFLLLNGAKVDIRDNNGQGPLHHATQLGHTGYAVYLFV